MDGPRALRTVLFLLAGLFITAVYSPGLSGGYVFDDIPNLVRNDATILNSLTLSELLQGALASDSGMLKRPLAMLSLSLERYFFGLNPQVMKATNIAIHLVNASLAFLLLYRLIAWRERQYGSQFRIQAATFAGITALAWAVAPINLTGVLYVIQRMESLASLFILLGLLGYVCGRIRLASGKPGALRWMWGALGIGMLLGLTAKESAVMLPVYAVLVEWLFFGFGARKSAERGAVLRIFTTLLILPAAAGLVWLAPRILSNPELSGRPFTLAERLWTEARVLWHYLYWIVAPNTGDLSLYHDDIPISRGPYTPWTTLPAALGLLALAIAAFLLRDRIVWVSFGILWFFVMHLLVSTVIGLELVFEHRNYLGSLGIILAGFALLLDQRVISLIFVRRFAMVAFVALFAFITTLRATEWSDPFRHAYFEATRNPDSPRAQYGLGKLLAETDPQLGSPRYALTMDILRTAMESPKAGLIVPQALILLHARNGAEPKAAVWEWMETYVTHHPISAEDRNALHSLVNARIEHNAPISAGALGSLLETAVASNTEDAVLLTIQANFIANVENRLERAGELLRRAVVLKPKSFRHWKNLASHQIEIGALDHAHHSLMRLRALDNLRTNQATIFELEKRWLNRVENVSTDRS